VSPLVGTAAVSGPAAALMRARGLPVSPVGIAAAYAPWLHTLVMDATDAGYAEALRARGCAVVTAPIVMTDPAAEAALAARVLAEAGR
jgi:LPPG:FO 2-phospho-L-lactate transferase